MSAPRPRAAASLARLLDPIAAVATAAGRGAVGVVRLSGPELGAVIEAVCGRALQPRHVTLCAFVDGAAQTIDSGLAIHFPAPHSYTGESVLELQAHGGPVVLQLLLARCLEAGAAIGLRLAEPGEFTQRAFLNGKLDLAQAEAVADLIDASTEAAARGAARSLQGEFSRQIDVWADQLVALRALVEATLDFPEEEIDFLERAGALARLEALIAGLQQLLARSRQGALLRDGLRVVLAGQPNVGKSSLLNALAGAELAIVTPIPGTTRDRVSETIQIHGVPLHITDTAGLRNPAQANDEVERIGIQRSWQAIEKADAVLFLRDLTRLGEAGYDAGDAAILDQLRIAAGGASPERLILQVFNKIDLALPSTLPAGTLALSARTGQGLEGLREELLERAGWQPSGEGGFIARQRHVQALTGAAQHIGRAQHWARQQEPPLELLAEELRLAHQALGTITGEFSADELLGEVFAHFCIGK